MSIHRDAKIAELIKQYAADFMVRESSNQSLITVTRTELSPDQKSVVIYLSVIPTSEEQKALAFAKRERSAFRDFVKAKSALQHIPTMDFELDMGEKNRQRIDDLTRGN
jgi:ribosome-binding factor A